MADVYCPHEEIVVHAMQAGDRCPICDEVHEVRPEPPAHKTNAPAGAEKGPSGEMKTTEEQLHLTRHALLAIHDLASARLRNPPLEQWVEHDLKLIVDIADKAMATVVQSEEQKP